MLRTRLLRSSTGWTRNDDLSERLGTLDTECLTLKEEIDNIWEACMSAAEPQLTILSGKCRYLQDQLKDNIARRAALEARFTDPGGFGFDEHFKKLLAVVAKPPVLFTSTLQELGEHVKKRPRKNIPLPNPAAGFTWNDPLWNEVAAPDSKLAKAGPEGLKSKFCKLLDSAPSSTSFEFHDVHSAPSVCGNDLKPDVVMSLRGKPVCPLTTGAIIDLKRQSVSPEMDKNIGQAVTYGRTCLQQLPSSLRDTVIVALTDLKSITLMRVSLKDGELEVDMSPKLPDTKHVLLQLLCCPPPNLLVQLPDLGPSLQITGFLGRGATSHVFQGTTFSGQEVAIKVPLEGTLDDELQMLRSLQDLGSVPSLASDSLVEGAIVLTPILQPLTLAAIWGDCLHLAVPALVSTFQEAHKRGIYNRDVCLSNLMIHSATSTLCAIDWGSATIEQHAPYEGTVHYASEAILKQLQQQQQHGDPALILSTPANDLESLVCTAFCLMHPDLRVELEKLGSVSLPASCHGGKRLPGPVDQPGHKPCKLLAMKTTPVWECACNACWSRICGLCTSLKRFSTFSSSTRMSVWDSKLPGLGELQ